MYNKGMTDINEKTGMCKICGCTWDNACFHPDFGTCWWINEEETICSHCSIPEIRDSEETEHYNMDSTEYENDNN
jgi:hypothetical protein